MLVKVTVEERERNCFVMTPDCPLRSTWEFGVLRAIDCSRFDGNIYLNTGVTGGLQASYNSAGIYKFKPMISITCNHRTLQ